MSFSSDSESDQGLPTSMTIQLNSRPTELLLSKRNTNGSVTVVRDDRDDSPLHQFQQLLPLSPSVELHSSIGEDQGELPDSCEDDSDSSSQEGSDAEETLPLPPAAVVAEVVAPISVSAPPVPSDLPPSISRLSPATGNSGAEDVPAEDRPSHVSLLGGKYLLFSNPTNAPQQQQTPCQTKNVLKCINVETRQHYFCKVVPRSATGLSLLAAYHRLDDFSDCINKIHEIILAPKLIYLIFPLNYGNVHSYLLAKKRLREGEAVHLFKQMVTAVQYCHDKGIVLRDLKLGKFVFLDRERTIIKLESLEDAVLLSDDSDDGLSDKHGCPNYVSPEKAEILRTNNKYPGKATDIWGLGVMLYTMLVGRYPFNDADHAKLFSKIRRGNFTIPEPLSTNSKCLIRCLLRKDPTGRLNCTEILRHPWILEERQQGRTSLPCTARDSQNRSGLGSRGNTMSRGNSNNNAISALPVFVTGSSRMPSHQMSMSGQSRGDAHHQMEEDQVVPVFNPSS